MNKKIIAGGMIAVGIILVGMTVYTMFRTKDTATNTGQSCQGLIGSWNAMMSDEATTRSTEDVAGMIKKVESQTGYENDVTCQYMLFRAHLTTAGIESAEKSLATLKQQTALGHNPSIELVDITSISEMERDLQLLRHYQDDSSETSEDGLTNAG